MAFAAAPVLLCRLAECRIFRFENTRRSPLETAFKEASQLLQHRARSFWKEAGELCGSGVKLGGMFVGENGVTDHVLALGVLLVPVLPQTECDLLHMGNEIVKLLEHRQKFLYGAAFCQTQFQLAE